MNKKLIALAVAGAFAAPAAMAQGNVTIGGKMHFSLDSLKGANAAGNDLVSKTNVSSNASNIYFKGSEDLGNGLSAIWQIQTFFSAGGTGNADDAFGATKDGVSSGNTYVGLSSKSWGTVVLGKHESPFKLVGRKVDLFGDQLGDNRNIVSNPNGAVVTTTLVGTGPNTTAVSPTSGGWDLRPNNVVAYVSPNFNGFTGTIAYVSNITSGAAQDGAAGTASTSLNPSAVNAWSGSAVYENGPIYLGLGYERHNFSKGLTGDNRNDEKAWRLSGGYNFGAFKLVGLYQRESDLWVDSNNNAAKRTVWGLGGAYTMGANTFKLQYYKAGDIKNTSYAWANDSGANMWALGVDHKLSKRTSVYAVYARTNNDRYARYSAFGGGHGDNPGSITPTAAVDSKDPSGFGVGVIHSF